MSYTHTFYALDLGALRGLYGSSDEALADQLAARQAEDIQDNDAFFEDAIEAGDCPDTMQAVRHILAGDIPDRPGTAAMYGYTLGILCQHLGTLVETSEDVARVRSHPYASKLTGSGPPIPIPVDPGDFPEIGFLDHDDLADEIRKIDRAPARARRSPLLSLTAKLTGGFIGPPTGGDEVVQDMEAYREALVFAQQRGLSLVSLRH